MALFEKKTVFRKFIDSITMAVYDNPELGPEFLDQLEESLVMADVGIETSAKIIEELNKAINYKYITREREIKKELSRILEELMDKGERNLMKDEYPLVILMIGINGGGSTGHCPTQNLVDAFETKNGKPVKDTEYSKKDPSYTDEVDSHNPYSNRDPRLQATIAVNNSRWAYNEPLEIWEGGLSGKPVRLATLTGYYLKKYVDGATSLRTGSVSSKNHVWNYFRYSEVLLNYAEAMVEAYNDYEYKNPPSLPLSAREAVNLIRKREGVGMPEFDAGMTVRDIQKILGTKTSQAVYHWIRGTRLPAVEHLVVLAATLGVSMDELIVVDIVALSMSDGIVLEKKDTKITLATAISLIRTENAKTTARR